jgi:hypothetical protein
MATGRFFRKLAQEGTEILVKETNLLKNESHSTNFSSFSAQFHCNGACANCVCGKNELLNNAFKR